MQTRITNMIYSKANYVFFFFFSISVSLCMAVSPLNRPTEYHCEQAWKVEEIMHKEFDIGTTRDILQQTFSGHFLAVVQVHTQNSNALI